MGVITGLTATRMLAIEAATVVGAHLSVDNLILTKQDGSTIDVGSVRGAPGPAYSNGVDTVNNQTIGGLKTFSKKVSLAPTANNDNVLVINAPTGQSVDLALFQVNGVTLAKIDNTGGITSGLHNAVAATSKFGRGAAGATGVAVSLSEDTVNAFIAPTGTPADIDLIIRPKGTTTGAIRLQNPGGTVSILTADKANHLVMGGSTPTVGTLGASVTAGSAVGCDSCHLVSLTFNGGAPGSPLCHVTFAQAYATLPQVQLSIAVTVAAGQFIQVYPVNVSTSGYDIAVAVAATPSNGAVLKVPVHVFSY